MYPIAPNFIIEQLRAFSPSTLRVGQRVRVLDRRRLRSRPTRGDYGQGGKIGLLDGTSTQPHSRRTGIAPELVQASRSAPLWDRSTQANTRVIMIYEMVSRGGLFTLSTTSGQGMDTCIE